MLLACLAVPDWNSESSKLVPHFWVEESATKSTYRLGVGFERCEKKGEKSAPMFVPSSSYHKEEEALKPTKAHYPSNPKPSFNPKREVMKEMPSQERKLSFACFVAVLVT
jgi:hypothetical protein